MKQSLEILTKSANKITKQHFTLLQNIFKNRSPNAYESISQSISDFLVNYLSDESAFDVIMSYLENTTKKDDFWVSLAKKERESITHTMPISIKIFKISSPNAEAIAPLLARSAVLKSPESDDFIKIAANSLKVKEGKTSFETAVNIMKCEEMSSYGKEVLEGLTRFIRANDHADIASSAVTSLCQSITDENAFAIEAVIETLPSALAGDNDSEVNAIIRLLSN